jgi:hypothetical protein
MAVSSPVCPNMVAGTTTITTTKTVEGRLLRRTVASKQGTSCPGPGLTSCNNSNNSSNKLAGIELGEETRLMEMGLRQYRLLLRFRLISNSPTGKLDLPLMVSKGKDKDKGNEETALLGIETGPLRARRTGRISPAVSL